MKLKEIFNRSKKELIKAGVEESESSAEFLIREVLGMDRAKFYASLDQEVKPEKQKKIQKWIQKRKKHQPVWQITGSVEFFGRSFKVNNNVLVPRPETELLVEQVLQVITNHKWQISNQFQNSKNQKFNRNSKFKTRSLKILDVGTGAGPIIITLALELANDQRQTANDFFASDVSAKALSVAKKNAKSLDAKIRFKKSNLFSAWKNQKFDLITANLPYVPHEDLPGLALDVHHHEPRISLDGGIGGLVIYEEFIKQLSGHVKKGSVVFCEIGKGQGKRFCDLSKKYFPKASCSIEKDLASIDRIAIIQFDK